MCTNGVTVECGVWRGIWAWNAYGAKRTRTADPLNAIEVLYQLSYSPPKTHLLL